MAQMSQKIEAEVTFQSLLASSSLSFSIYLF
jgi:hypothetical protein